MSKMQKKLISLTDRQVDFLTRRSARTGAPVARIIRMLLDEHIEKHEFLIKGE